MSIWKEEKKLFQEWRLEKGYDRFIRDGVFDEATWTAQEPKITFVLKDADWLGGDGNLRWNLIHDPHPRNWTTWNNVARWAKALLEGGEYPGYISKETRILYLKKVSFLNLKKTGGGPQNEVGELWEAAKSDAAFIRRQLLLYQPDIIICGGKNTTAKFLEEAVLQCPASELPVRDRGWVNDIPCYYIHFPGKEQLTPVVGFRHPQVYGGHREWKLWYDKMREIGEALLVPREKGQTASPANPP